MVSPIIGWIHLLTMCCKIFYDRCCKLGQAQAVALVGWYDLLVVGACQTIG